MSGARPRGRVPGLTSGGPHPGAYRDAPRADIAALLPPDAHRILDVGCGSGGFGRLVRASRPGAELFGIELDAGAASTARGDYADVATGDAERLDPPWPRGTFDCLVYADVLEHFATPGDVLRRHLPLLRAGGAVVASVPNVRHARVLRRLVLRGRWDYFEAGITDWTHLRFWTARTFEEFLLWHGLRVVRHERPPSSRLGKAARIASFGLLADFVATKNYFVARLGRPRDVAAPPA